MTKARYRVGRSPIHGRGVFALAAFRRNDHIGTFQGARTRRNGTHVLWLQDESGGEVGIRGRNGLRFLNHATKPNAEFRGRELFALRKIEPGEEITLHYGEAWEGIE